HLLFCQGACLRAVEPPDRMILTHDHQGLIAPFGFRKRDRERRPQVKHAKGVQGVQVAPNGNLVIQGEALPEMLELPKVLVALDVAYHLNVRLGTDVVVGGDLRGIRSMSRCQGKD
ncbi:MAG: hypothetical protein OER74_16165, partial [Desulfobacteraceae bacterium]|nr:hypothetical protein [Desulfobacteraceae bacterium]